MKYPERMLNPKVLYVVADAFRNFARNDTVITQSDFLAQAPALLNQAEPISVLVGQGIDAPGRDSLLAALKANGGPGDNLIPLLAPVSPSLQELTHKHQTRNVMVSEFHQIDLENFEARLAIDASCAEMSDHVTGQHLQAALVSEAARQMGLAALETLAVADGKGRSAYAVTQSSMHYSKFLFPLPVSIRCLAKLTEREEGVARFEVVTDFLQSGERAVQSRMSIIRYPLTTAERVEAKQAKRALSRYLGELSGGNLSPVAMPAIPADRKAGG